MARLGRPQVKRERCASFRLTQQEWGDLRKCAIAENCSMVEYLRDCIRKTKRVHKSHGTWPDTVERGE